MITKEARAEAQSRGAHKVLAFYGLDKSAAAAAPGILGTLSAAGSRALTSGSKAMAHGRGTTGQNLMAGVRAAGKGFHRGGGTTAAGKALGIGAAGAGLMYGAGRAFGAGQADAQRGAVKLNGLREDLIGGEFQAEKDIPGLGTSTALGMLGGDIAHTLQGGYRGNRHGQMLRGAARGLVGSVGGSMLGAGLGAAVSNDPIGGAAYLGGVMGRGLGAHLLTRKYLADPKTPAQPASPELDEIRLTDPIDMPGAEGASGTKVGGIREEIIGGKFDPYVDLPGLATSYFSTHLEGGVPLHGALRGAFGHDGTLTGGALRSTVGGATGGVLARYLARRLGGSRFSPMTETATRLGTAAGSHLLTRKYLTEPDEE